MSAEANDNASSGAGDGPVENPFGHRPDERVYAPGRYPPRPDVRTRVAPLARAGGLDFEPEVEGQRETLAALLAPAPAPQPSIAFEPEKGDALDRVAGRPAARGDGATDEDIASLLELAAGKDAGGAGAPPAAPGPGPQAGAGKPPPLDPAAGQAAFRGRSATSGDIEAELFGPGSKRLAARSAPAPRADAPPAAAAAVPASAPVPAAAPAGEGEAAPAPAGGEPQPTQSLASVFLSEQVLGKRRRRRTSGILRRSAQFRAVADRWFGKIYHRTRRAVRAVDRFTGRLRLPLANIFWSAAIAGLLPLFGLALPFAGAVFGACLVLTIAGQPARNLVGIAGVMILAASLAEVARQRERFLKIFLDLFG